MQVVAIIVIAHQVYNKIAVLLRPVQQWHTWTNLLPMYYSGNLSIITANISLLHTYSLFANTFFTLGILIELNLQVQSDNLYDEKI